MSNPKALGQVAFEAYREYQKGLTFDGRYIPQWGDLPAAISNAWNVVGEEVLKHCEARLNAVFDAGSRRIKCETDAQLARYKRELYPRRGTGLPESLLTSDGVLVCPQCRERPRRGTGYTLCVECSCVHCGINEQERPGKLCAVCDDGYPLVETRTGERAREVPAPERRPKPARLTSDGYAVPPFAQCTRCHKRPRFHAQCSLCTECADGARG